MARPVLPRGACVGPAGHVRLEVPASSRRYRTWAYGRNVTRPGRWHAVVRGPDGAVLARRAFTMTPPSR